MELHFEEVPHLSEKYRRMVALRDAELRKPLGLAFSEEELQAEGHCHHLAAFRGEALVACIVMQPLDAHTVKMRQVATAAAFQRQGIGRQMAGFAEQWAWEKGFRTITLHARLVAVPFYEKMNYARVGDLFTEVGIPHYRMQKENS